MDVLLSEASYEQVARRFEYWLNTGQHGFSGIYSTNQQNFRAAWNKAMDEVHKKCLEDFDKWQPLRRIMLDAMDEFNGDQVQMHRKVYSVNSTFYGQDAEKDHSPENNH